MTVTSNIHPGLSGWANQTYAAGARVSTGGSAYQCVSPGLSTSAPTGTFGTINNGGVATWTWLSRIDYTTIQAWINAWPGTLVDSLVGQVWADSIITTALGTPFFTTPGTHTMGAFTATLTPAPGEGIRADLRDNNIPLAASAPLGVALVLPASGVGGINYVSIADTNFVLDGIQFVDPNSTSGSTIIAALAPNFTMRGCIVDGYSQGGGACIVELAPGCTSSLLANCLFIDRNPNAATSGVVQVEAATCTHNIANCTLVSVVHNTVSLNGAVHSGVASNTAAVTITNTAILNWDFPLVFTVGGAAQPAVCTVNHCCLTAANAPTLYTNGGSNLFSKVYANQVISAGGLGEYTNEYTSEYTTLSAMDLREPAAGSDTANAGATDLTHVPTATDIAGRARVAPWDIGAWELSAPAAVYPRAISQQQELPTSAHPIPRLVGSIVTSVSPVPAVVRSLFARQQELPASAHPSPRMAPGPSGAQVKSARTDYLLSRQERPEHPPPLVMAGLQGPNILPPTIVQQIMIRQDSTPQVTTPAPMLASGPVTGTVRAPVTNQVQTRQQLPDHPPSALAAGVQGPSVRPPIADSILTRQHYPDYYQPQMRPGPTGKTVRPPVRDVAISGQQLPDHPTSLLRTGIQVLSVAPPQHIGRVLTTQQQPDHPSSLLTSRQPDPPPPPFLMSGVRTTQEQPPYQASALLPGPQGPDVRTPVFDRIATVQQQPDHLQPLLRSGPTGQTVGPPVTSTIQTVQQQPQHPLPAASAGPPGPSVRPPVSDTALVRQEQPGHPPSLMSAGPSGAAVLTKVTDRVWTVQMMPDHPLPQVRAGAQGPNVQIRVTDQIWTVQQQPDHPQPQVRAGAQGPSVAPPSHTGTILTRQEQPAQIYPVLGVGVQTTTILPAVSRVLTTRQEQPSHPLPSLAAGLYTSRAFVRGRILVLISDR